MSENVLVYKGKEIAAYGFEASVTPLTMDTRARR
jgi:hypothetical protein